MFVLFDSYNALLAIDDKGDRLKRWRVNGYAFPQKGIAWVDDYLYVIEETPSQIWKVNVLASTLLNISQYYFPLDEAMDNSQLMMKCYRPTAPVVIMIALFGCIYTVLALWPIVQLIRMYLFKMPFRTKVLMRIFSERTYYAKMTSLQMLTLISRMLVTSSLIL
jgi:hypothetical protein